jgi:hypothetical protein
MQDEFAGSVRSTVPLASDDGSGSTDDFRVRPASHPEGWWAVVRRGLPLAYWPDEGDARAQQSALQQGMAYEESVLHVLHRGKPLGSPGASACQIDIESILLGD